MKITILTGLGESEFASNFCLARALEKAGCETWLMGPNYDERRSILDLPEVDYVLPDRPYPHFYSYKEVVANSPWKPDVIFAIDPRGAVNGEKPKGVVSCFYSTDNHRAGELHTKLTKEGQYDVVFVGQGGYLPFFEKSAPIVKVLWPAVESSRFPYDFMIGPECDIAFVGHTGLDINGPLDQDYNGSWYCKKPSRKTYSGNAPSYDYAERGELLFRLCYDFNVRLYQPAWKTPSLSLALQQGKIGFNHSILHDLSIRNFEVMAAERALVTDDICLPPTLPSFRSIVADGMCSRVYPSLYRPFYANFDVQYAYVKRIIEDLLSDDHERENMSYRARNYALSRHTWDNRATEVIQTIEKAVRQ